MSKKIGKLLLLTAVAGAAAYGTYAYLQKKDKANAEPIDEDFDDDFDDFGEDLDEDLPPTKERSYVPLNFEKAEAFATEAFQKAKEVISDSVQQVKETVKSVADSQGYHTCFTDITSNAKDSADDVVVESTDVTANPSSENVMEKIKDTAETVAEHVADSAEEAAEAVAEQTEELKETVEEFFDDDEV